MSARTRLLAVALAAVAALGAGAVVGQAFFADAVTSPVKARVLTTFDFATLLSDVPDTALDAYATIPNATGNESGSTPIATGSDATLALDFGRRNGSSTWNPFTFNRTFTITALPALPGGAAWVDVTVARVGTTFPTTSTAMSLLATPLVPLPQPHRLLAGQKVQVNTAIGNPASGRTNGFIRVTLTPSTGGSVSFDVPATVCQNTSANPC